MNRFVELCARALPSQFRRERGVEIVELADERSSSPSMAFVEGVGLLKAGSVLRARNNLEMSVADNLSWGVALASGFVVGVGILTRSLSRIGWQVGGEWQEVHDWVFVNGTFANPWLSGVACVLSLLVCLSLGSRWKAVALAVAATLVAAVANMNEGSGFAASLAYEARWLLVALLALIAVSGDARNQHVFAFISGAVFSAATLFLIYVGRVDGRNIGYTIDLLLERSLQPDWFGWACLCAAVLVPTVFTRCAVCMVLVLASSLPGEGAVRDLRSLAIAVSVVIFTVVADTIRTRVLARRLQIAKTAQ